MSECGWSEKSKIARFWREKCYVSAGAVRRPSPNASKLKTSKTSNATMKSAAIILAALAGSASAFAPSARLAMESKSMTYWCRLPQRRGIKAVCSYFCLCSWRVMLEAWCSLLRDNVISNSRTSSRTIFSHFSFSYKKARLYETPGKINHKIDLESPKVATQEKLSAGDKKVYCRCWQSGTFPLCDGGHMKHNEAWVCLFGGLFGYRFTFYLIGSFVFLSFNLLIFVG